MKPIALVFLIAASCWSLLNPGTARAAMIDCKSCSDEQMTHLIRQLGAGGLVIEGRVHVTDIGADRIRAFEVRCLEWVQPLSAPGEAGSRPSVGRWGSACGNLSAVPAAIDPQFAYYFATLRAFYIDTGGTMRKVYDQPAVSIGGRHGAEIAGGSAFDVAGNLAFRGRVGDGLRTCDLCAQGAQWLGVAVESYIAMGVQVEILVGFADSVAARDTMNSGGSYDYIENSARAPDGTAIPQRIEEFAGFDASFGPNNQNSAQGFIDYLSGRAGVTMRGQLSGSSFARISCTWDGETLTCTVT